MLPGLGTATLLQFVEPVTDELPSASFAFSVTLAAEETRRPPNSSAPAKSEPFKDEGSQPGTGWVWIEVWVEVCLLIWIGGCVFSVMFLGSRVTDSADVELLDGLNVAVQNGRRFAVQERRTYGTTDPKETYRNLHAGRERGAHAARREMVEVQSYEPADLHSAASHSQLRRDADLPGNVPGHSRALSGRGRRPAVRRADIRTICPPPAVIIPRSASCGQFLIKHASRAIGAPVTSGRCT